MLAEISIEITKLKYLFFAKIIVLLPVSAFTLELTTEFIRVNRRWWVE